MDLSTIALTKSYMSNGTQYVQIKNDIKANYTDRCIARINTGSANSFIFNNDIFNIKLGGKVQLFALLLL